MAEFEKNHAIHCNDSPGARALGIKMYAGRPVYFADDQIYATLCVANSKDRPLSTEAKHALWLFASLISQQVQRDRLADELESTKRSLISAQRKALQSGLNFARLNNLASRKKAKLLSKVLQHLMSIFKKGHILAS